MLGVSIGCVLGVSIGCECWGVSVGVAVKV